MSIYRKAPVSLIHGYNPGRRYGQPSCPYNASIYPYHAMGTTSTSSAPGGYPYQTHLTPLAYPQNPVCSPCDGEVAGPYVPTGSNNLEVMSYSISRGPKNSRIYVRVTSPYELLTSNQPSFFLTFGARKCVASVHRSVQKGTPYSYSVTSEVPALSEIGWQTSRISVFMVMETEDGDVKARVAVGEFDYSELESQNSGTNDTVQSGSRKRKASDNTPDYLENPAKKRSIRLLRPSEEYENYNYSQNEVNSPYTYMHPTSTYGNVPETYSKQTGNFQGQTPPRHMQYGYTGPRKLASPTSGASSPAAVNWTSYPSKSSNISQTKGILTNSPVHNSSLSSVVAPSSSVPANPPLFRTSTLQKSPSPANSPHGGRSGQPFNAYALYSQKAKLEVIGDLASMAHNWTEEEVDSRRRLVLFERSQTGSTITTTFRPVGVDDRSKDSICISCIYWEEKNECFVTSVDTIYLLQKLVAVQFTVEEKNRIRRNLEGFRPLTVSKGKPESEDFFKIIMAFPIPKPRNIEKDVKVFHWKDLSGALKKIIGKYSASPSATAPPPPPPSLLTPVSLSNYATETSSASLAYQSDQPRTSSPHSFSSSATSTAYPLGVPTPQGNDKEMIMPLPIITGSSPPDLRLSTSHEPSIQNSWQVASHHILPVLNQRQQQETLNSFQRNPWDMNSYIEVDHHVLGNSAETKNEVCSSGPGAS